MAATSLLGLGFNIFGRTDLASGTTLPVVKTSVNQDDDNIVTSPGDEATAITSSTFTSRQQVTEHFAAEASLSYSGLVFSGEFSAKYQSESASDVQTAYGMYEVVRPTQITKLANTDRNVLSESFGLSTDVLNLPTKFDPAAPEQFFRIFRRFGTHIVTEVSLGGRLNAYTSAQLSSTMTSVSAEADMKMEYAGLFSAEASAAWGKVTENWGSSREITFEVLGGQPGPLASFVPEIGATANTLVSDWIGTVDASPAIVGYQLSPLSIVFDGETADAVDQAIDAYVMSLLLLEAWEYTMPRPVGPADPNLPGQFASSIALPGQAPQRQPQAAQFWGQPTTLDARMMGWMWLVILDSESPNFSATGSLSKGYFFSDGFADQVDADVAAARALFSSPLVMLLGEFGPYNVSGEVTTGTLIPQGLQDLLLVLGFDLQSAIDAADGDCIMALAATSSSTPVAVIKTLWDLDDLAIPTRAVAQYVETDMQLVDASGTIVSPVTA